MKESSKYRSVVRWHDDSILACSEFLRFHPYKTWEMVAAVNAREKQKMNIELAWARKTIQPPTTPFILGLLAYTTHLPHTPPPSFVLIA